MKTLTQKDICTPMFTAALLTIGKTWKQSKCSSMDEWIKKMWYIYNTTQPLKKGNPAVRDSMDGP